MEPYTTVIVPELGIGRVYNEEKPALLAVIENLNTEINRLNTDVAALRYSLDTLISPDSIALRDAMYKVMQDKRQHRDNLTWTRRFVKDSING